MKKITVFITHSFGELDILMPLFYEINNQQKVKIKIIITIKKIHEKLQKNEFYLKIIDYLNIIVVYSPLFNKFNFNKNHFLNRNSNLLNKYLNIKMKALEPVKYLKLLLICYFSLKMFIKNFSIISSNIVMIQTTNPLKSNVIYFLLIKILKKKLIIYHHGHSLNTVSDFTAKIPDGKNFINTSDEIEKIKRKKNKIRLKKENSIFLLFHQQNEHWAKHIGYHNLQLLGFPKFFPEWIKLIKKDNEFDIKGKYVVIFSRESEHKYYMDKNNYEYLFKSSCEVIKEKLPLYKIYIKTHPRENIDFLKSLIKKYDIKNIEITDIYSLMLSKNAFLIISFWTSAILDSLALKIPSVEFYIETKQFKIIEPKGSPYRYSGIDTVDSKHLLKAFVDRRINDKYKIPEFANKMSATKDLSIFLD